VARLWPHRHPGNSHFLASLVREGDTDGHAPRGRGEGALREAGGVLWAAPPAPDGPSVLRYLAGEELGLGADEPRDVRALGVDASAAELAVLVSVAGVPVGWGQRRGTRLRNRYPKGLRRRR
ncbi:MAG: hypothetical protein GVY27_09115, partial [Deinococcus-Thermus bacterium]|jgi:hypothetical protein|nr:hypothetical protein [Deinococcota bacterium]